MLGDIYMDIFSLVIFSYCGVMFLLMIGVIVNSVLKEKRAFTEEVEATIVDVKVSNSGGVPSYRPIYRFEINGESYDVPCNLNKVTTKPNKAIKGSKVMIKVNPNDPGQIKDKFEFMDIKNNILMLIIVGVILASVFCAMGILVYEIFR